MKHNFFLTLCVVFLCMSASALAQEISSQASALQGEALFDALKKRVTLASDVSGTFTQQKFIEVLPQPLSSSGTVEYQQSSGLIWTTLQPIESQLLLDEQGIRQNVDGETVWEIDARQPAAVTITRVMAGLLAADWDVLQQYFDISGMVGEQHWTLELIPIDTAMQSIVTSMTVTGDEFVDNLIMHEANGDRTEISFVINGGQ